MLRLVNYISKVYKDICIIYKLSYLQVANEKAPYKLNCTELFVVFYVKCLRVISIFNNPVFA